jgi:hypothetical protein
MTPRREQPEPPPERRQAPRFTPSELQEPVLVVGSRLVNIGPGGLMLEAPVPLAPDSPLQLHLLVAGERTDVEARVRGCVSRPVGRGAAWGVGVQFEAVDPLSRERLERALGIGPRTRGRA